MYREVKSWLGLLHDEKDSALANRGGTSFEVMTAQLMVDLIYAILYSITENTVGIKKSADFRNYQNYDFTNKNVVLIESMIVKNPNSLQVNTDESEAVKSGVELPTKS